jgi:hypothetical protein
MESQKRENEEIQALPDVNDQEERVQWCCPHCAHSLQYKRQYEDVAKLAMVSHLSRCHGLPFWHFIVNMRDLKEAAEQYFSAGSHGKPEPATDCVSGYLRFSP